jgi:hypothetical protein
MLYGRTRRISYERPRRLLPDERRRVYETPVLEALGRWSALTLPQTVPITLDPRVSSEYHGDDPSDVSNIG